MPLYCHTIKYTIKGRANIQKHWEVAVAAGAQDAEVATTETRSNSDFGYEIGRLQMKIPMLDGSIFVERGKYTELLKRGADGKWLSTDVGQCRDPFLRHWLHPVFRVGTPKYGKQRRLSVKNGLFTYFSVIFLQSPSAPSRYFHCSLGVSLGLEYLRC
jgi:hypothetical protein